MLPRTFAGRAPNLALPGSGFVMLALSLSAEPARGSYQIYRSGSRSAYRTRAPNITRSTPVHTQIGTYGCLYSLERGFCLGPSHVFFATFKTQA